MMRLRRSELVFSYNCNYASAYSRPASPRLMSYHAQGKFCGNMMLFANNRSACKDNVQMCTYTDEQKRYLQNL